MIRIPLRDRCFEHKINGSVNCDEASSLGAWDRESVDQNFIVLTHTNLGEVFKYKEKNYKVYGWLIEPPVINRTSYKFIRENYQHFEKIFTWSKELLDLSDKFYFIPFGGSWIKPNDRQIYEKNKNLSMMISKKHKAPGHQFRHEIVENFPNKFDIFGKGWNPIENKITALKDYRFQIVVENCTDDFWFTEKIIDCFQTGTIPVYWGCDSIGDFFNENGILKFKNLKGLSKILNHLNEGTYIDLLPYVKENFELSKKYILSDDFIFNYFKNINDSN